jgi:methionyl-tRNA synthetase
LTGKGFLMNRSVRPPIEEHADFRFELANDLGNLLSRVLTMISKYFGGEIPPGGPEQPIDRVLRETAVSIPQKVEDDLSSLSFTRYLQDVWTLVTRANRYVEESTPWTLAKNKDLERLRLIALYLYPVMPSTCQKIWGALGVDRPLSSCRMQEELIWGRLAHGTVIQPGSQLFPRIDKKKKTEKKMEKTTEESKQPPHAAAGPDLIGIEDFMKVDLRVGRIVSAERVEKSMKLVKLKVDIGTETRQVVAGIGTSYTPEELTGKSIVIVANLKPAKLMGIESQGMLLAASDGDLLAVATFDRETRTGSRVK